MKSNSASRWEAQLLPCETLGKECVGKGWNDHDDDVTQ